MTAILKKKTAGKIYMCYENATWYHTVSLEIPMQLVKRKPISVLKNIFEGNITKCHLGGNNRTPYTSPN